MRAFRQDGTAAWLLLCVALGGLLLAVAGLTYAAPAAQQIQTVSLTPLRVETAGQSRCGSLPATSGASCLGFDGRDVRALPDLWVVGYENNRDLGEKHVLQTVAVFDLAPLRALPDRATLNRVLLTYVEASTMRRSPTGKAQDGILPTCNTGLGVPVDGWDGTSNRVVPTRPAAVGGVEGATTGNFGAWDVTPQLRQWLDGAGNERVFVLRGDDESLDVSELGMCLSYVFDVGLAVEFTVPQ